MAKEKHRFLLRQKIREPRTPSGKIIDLKQEIELEVNWSEQDPSTGEIEEQIIEFEKDGKKYKFQLNATIQKGWFRDHVKSGGFGMSGDELSKQNFYMENMGGEPHVFPLQTRTTGWFCLGGFLLLLFLGIGAYFF